jgi:hypothetical protein
MATRWFSTEPRWGLKCWRSRWSSHPAAGLQETFEAARAPVKAWIMQQPSVVLASGCRGVSRTGVIISVHKSYADLERFMSDHKRMLGDLFSEDDTAIVNLRGGEIIKPFHLKYLAEAV